jgi:hypothetical protein
MVAGADESIERPLDRLDELGLGPHGIQLFPRFFPVLGLILGLLFGQRLLCQLHGAID